MEAGRVDGAEVDLSPGGCSTPEGGKVLGRGSAPMEAMLSIGPYDAEQAAGVKFCSSVPVFVPVQETHNKQGELAAVSRGAARAIAGRERGLRGAVEIY